MSNTMLYNLERPLRFSDVGGNEEIKELLRLLIKNKTWENAHFIFSGKPGNGKTTLGRILSRAINCTNPQEGEPCNECDNCKAHLSDHYGDYIEIDATQYSKVEDAKRLVDLAGQYPINPKGQRIILLDEAHVLSNAAFDKFLKLLESAAVRTTFIFCTTDLHLFRPAIVSRCFNFNVRPLTSRELAQEIVRICKKNEIEYDNESISKLAHHYAGRARDAVKMLDLHYKAHGNFKGYHERTQESMILEAFKLAFYNKVEDYLSLVETLDATNLFRNCCRALNEVFLYPHVNSNLIPTSQIEEFKNLIDNQNLKGIIKDVITLKPTDPYALNLLLATVTELGINLTEKATVQRGRRGRRFRDEPQEQQRRELVTREGVDIDEDDEISTVDQEEFESGITSGKVEAANKITESDLTSFGFKKV